MFRSMPDTELAPVVMDPADLLVPLSVLALDLSAPSVGGWPAYLAGRRRRTGCAASRRCGLLLWAPAGLLLLFLILIAKRCCSIFSPALPLTRR